MPERQTVHKPKQKLRRGRAASTAAGELVREEMHHVREGKHGARSTKQAIAIGLSKARRAGVPLKSPKRGTSARTRRSAARDYQTGRFQRTPQAPSPRRGRGHTSPSATARKAVRTKGSSSGRPAARKAARPRARHR